MTSTELWQNEYYDLDDAFDAARYRLAHEGLLTRVWFSNVPDIRCLRCGQELFDFQRSGEKAVGQDGDMIECFFDVVYGTVCDRCAREIVNRSVGK